MRIRRTLAHGASLATIATCIVIAEPVANPYAGAALADCVVTNDAPPPNTAANPSSGDTITCTAAPPNPENTAIANGAADDVTVLIGDGQPPEAALSTTVRAIELRNQASVTVRSDGRVTTTNMDAEGIQLDEDATVRIDGLVRVFGESSEAIDMDNGDVVVGSTGIVEALGPNRTPAQQAEAIEIDNGGGLRPAASTVTVLEGGRVFSQSAEAVQVRDGSIGTLDMTIAGSVATGVAGGTAVQLGNGADTLTLLPSYELIGLADGSAASDTLFLTGASIRPGIDAVVDAEQYINFETFRKQDSSTYEVVGTAPGFAPQGFVEAGTLLVNGSISNSAVEVQGGTLGGVGTIGALDAVGGTVAPGPLGAAIGTLNVANDARFGPGSTYAVDLSPAPAPNPAGTDFPGLASDRLAVDGAVTIDGGTIVANGLPGDYPVAGAFTIITADQGVTGTFDAVSDNLPDIDLRDIYNPNSVQLVYRRAPIGSPKEVFPSTIDAIADAGRLYTETLQRRGALTVGSIPTETVPVSPEPTPGFVYKDGFVPPPAEFVTAPPPRFGVWVAGMVAHADVDGAVDTTGREGPGIGVPGFEADAYGAALGVEGYFGPGGSTLGGVSVGYTRTDVTTDRAIASTGEVDAFHVGAYAATVQGPLALSGALGYARLDYEFERNFALLDGTPVTATSDADGDLYAASMAASYDLAGPLGFAAFRVAPTATLDALHVTRDATRETGVGVLNLAVAGDETTRVYTGLGVTLGTALEVAGAVVTPEASVMWEHAFGDLRTVTSSAIPVADARFDTAGAAIDRDRLRLGVGVGVGFSERVAGHVRYDGAFGSHSRSHRGSVGLTVRF